VRRSSPVPYPLPSSPSPDLIRGSVPAIPVLKDSRRFIPSGSLPVTPSPCHGRPCAGHPDAMRRRASPHRDHRDEPGDDGEGQSRPGSSLGTVMTREVVRGEGEDRVRCNVLTLFLTRCIIWAIPVCIPADEGRAREASQMWGGERSCGRPRKPAGGRPLAAVCWSKSKRLKVPRARRRPALPSYP
jgi:hypothetical protein